MSVREDMACSILRDVGSRFAQTIVCTDPLFVKPLLDRASATGLDWRGLNTSLIMGEEVLVEAQREYIAGRMDIDLDSDTRRVIASSFGVGELGLNLLFESRETIRLRRAMRRLPELALLLAGRRALASLPALFCFNPLRCHIEVLNPDADGFGELCFTMLDRHAVIPLPRYCTGDLGRLVDPVLLSRACESAGLPRPWMPMVAVRGRAGDRISGLPSVEDIKEAIYADPELADALTGAFRLRAGANQELQLLLQRNSHAPGPALSLLGRFSDRLECPARAIEVVVVAPSEFPYRPWLDYERKFRYIEEQL